MKMGPAIRREVPQNAGRSAMLRERGKRMDYEADYKYDDISDDDTVDEPRQSFTQEVRNLFGVSVVTDLIVEQHTDRCRDLAERPGHRCSCAAARYYYLGHRPIPEEGIEKVRITPTFQELAFLEDYCESNIHSLRAQAKSKNQAL
jgi:hypothetical protein